MRKISDVIEKYKETIDKFEMEKYFNIPINDGNFKALKLLYSFNVCGFYIPIKPSLINDSLDNINGWIELAKKDKKIELHSGDDSSQLGDIDLNSFELITSEEKKSNNFIRIPDRYLYTNIHLNVKKNNYKKINLTGEDIYMLDDAKNIIEQSQICDTHEDGA